MLTMFWTTKPNAVQELLELTREHRCKDPWLSALLLRARHGNMEHELYCFMHGLPTKHTGSWMPDSNDVLCGQRRCRALPAEWERALSTGTPQTWEQRGAQECHVCKQHRLKRKRVLSSTDDSVVANIKFSDAPLIHPWNAPKYHASLVRARRYARDTNRILLWVVCEDSPIHSDLKTLPEEELNIKRKEWAMYHDQKTSGIMGLLPLVKNCLLYTSDACRRRLRCRSRWSPYH